MLLSRARVVFPFHIFSFSGTGIEPPSGLKKEDLIIFIQDKVAEYSQVEERVVPKDLNKLKVPELRKRLQELGTAEGKNKSSRISN